MLLFRVYRGLPSRKLTYPTLGKRKINESKVALKGDMLVIRRVYYPVL